MKIDIDIEKLNQDDLYQLKHIMVKQQNYEQAAIFLDAYRKLVVDEESHTLIKNSAVIGSRGSINESNTILFSVDGEDKLKINKDGFFVGDVLIKEDETIYEQFKEWLDLAVQDLNEQL